MDVENRLRISGHAETKVVPDRACWTVTVRTEDDDRDAAFRRCASAREGLVQRLEAVEMGCVSAGRIAVAEEIEHYWVVSNELREEVARQLERTRLPKGVVAQIGESIGERRRRRRCFAATATLGVDVAVDASGAVPKLLVAKDVASSQGPWFKISRDEEISDDLRARAVENARARAAALAEAAGRKLGRALVVSDRDESLAALTGAGNSAPLTEGGAPRFRAALAMKVPAPTGEPQWEEEAPIVMEITPEPVEMSETMTVVFELIDRD
ncbi:MAG: SIMPL domain-containing protein [Candidatus Dormibacteria bacterium]|jgi:uncharacterized protein YggE